MAQIPVPGHNPGSVVHPPAHAVGAKLDILGIVLCRALDSHRDPNKDLGMSLTILGAGPGSWSGSGLWIPDVFQILDPFGSTAWLWITLLPTGVEKWSGREFGLSWMKCGCSWLNWDVLGARSHCCSCLGSVFPSLLWLSWHAPLFLVEWLVPVLPPSLLCFPPLFSSGSLARPRFSCHGLCPLG